MSVFKLTELYKTKFFYLTFNNDLVYLFTKIIDLGKDPNISYHAGSPLHEKLFEAVKKGEDVKIDLAGARFTPDTTPTIDTYIQAGVNFIDSKDKVRNEVLSENASRYAIDRSEFKLLPKFSNTDKITDYMSALSREVVYTVPESHEELYVPLTILIMLFRPTIKFCLGSKERTIFNHIATVFTSHELSQYDEFYFITNNGVMIIAPNGKGLYDIQEKSDLTLNEVLGYGNLVPTIIGKKRLAGEEPWASLAKRCFTLVDSYKFTYQPTLGEVLGISTDEGSSTT